MKVQIASDLHLEHFGPYFAERRALAPAPGAELLVLAGDIGSAVQSAREFAHWPVPVVTVAGNHEFYGFRMDDVLAASRLAAQESGVHFLDMDELQLPGVRVLGCTLWTDYRLYGSPHLGRKFGKALADHRLIATADGRRFQPEDAELLHYKARSWLAERLAQPFEGKTIVVTHHAPHPKCEHEQWRGDPCNPAFISDLRELMGGVDLWVHGHIHNNADVREGRCRVVCNPRGYPLNLRDCGGQWEALRFENTFFKPNLVIEV